MGRWVRRRHRAKAVVVACCSPPKERTQCPVRWALYDTAGPDQPAVRPHRGSHAAPRSPADGRRTGSVVPEAQLRSGRARQEHQVPHARQGVEGLEVPEGQLGDHLGRGTGDYDDYVPAAADRYHSHQVRIWLRVEVLPERRR